MPNETSTLNGNARLALPISSLLLAVALFTAVQVQCATNKTNHTEFVTETRASILLITNDIKDLTHEYHKMCETQTASQVQVESKVDALRQVTEVELRHLRAAIQEIKELVVKINPGGE